MADNSSIKVALRIRPLVQSELNKGSKNAIEVFKEVQQVRISEKAFTFNHVFGSETSQEDFYKQSVEPMIPNLFQGYNCTILAYGQTGSGKTHSMGTAYTGQGEMGIIPRAVQDIFSTIRDNFTNDYKVTVSFIELYQEVLYDLLSSKPREQCVMEIREDARKGTFIPGLTHIPAESYQDVLDTLQLGSKGRATSSTHMNAQSSRSHAIFTINISISAKDGSESKTAKFHLVDLAGSERPKKTGATGVTFKEGININRGLFVLGNVISALGEERGAPIHVNYRDSNLTRLLKDSLGGNSITMMVACVSPADYNAEETMSTLRYADRARQIKNKPVVNEDPHAAELGRLHKQIKNLQLQLSAQGGPSISYQEINALKAEIADLKSKLHLSVTHTVALNERVLMMQTANEGVAEKFQRLQGDYSAAMQSLNMSMEQNDMDAVKQQMSQLKSIENHLTDIDNESKRSETELKNCGRTNVKDNDGVSYITAEEIGEEQQTHTTKQMAINAQLQHVNSVLAVKEDLARQLASSGMYMVDMAEMNENQNKIAVLEKEKCELMQQLKHAQGASGKIAEQRRKRVQDLEAQLQELNRKVQGQARLIKLKEKDDAKIKKLNIEITQMKGEKVKLVKTMRQESERFRKWKVNRERELSKLQNQDRKRVYELASMKRKHHLQENVWKRKLEEAASSAKRLKDALALRKNVQDTKLKGKVERLGPWVQQELTIHVNIVAAQVTVETLLSDRAMLQEQIDKLKENEAEHAEEIEKLEEQIDLRSTQLQDLNQKLIENNDSDRNSTRFDNVQTMAEAKYVLQVMFDKTAEFKKAEIEKEHQVDGLQGELDEAKKAITQLETKVENAELQHTLAMAESDKNYEEKTLLLLKQLRGVQDNNIDEQTKHRIDAQEEMISRLQSMVETLEREKKELVNELEDTRIAVSEIKAESLNTPPPKKKRASKDPRNETVQVVESPSAFDETIANEDLDDVENDPDWRNTPLGKKVVSRRVLHEAPSQVVPLKRSHSGGCGCKTTCTQRRCPCRKVNQSCCELCKCKVGVCENRDKEMSHGSELIDSGLFKKPRLTGDSLPNVLMPVKFTTNLDIPEA